MFPQEFLENIKSNSSGGIGSEFQNQQSATASGAATSSDVGSLHRSARFAQPNIVHQQETSAEAVGKPITAGGDQLNGDKMEEHRQRTDRGEN